MLSFDGVFVTVDRDLLETIKPYCKCNDGLKYLYYPRGSLSYDVYYQHFNMALGKDVFDYEDYIQPQIDFSSIENNAYKVALESKICKVLYKTPSDVYRFVCEMVNNVGFKSVLLVFKYAVDYYLLENYFKDKYTAVIQKQFLKDLKENKKITRNYEMVIFIGSKFSDTDDIETLRFLKKTRYRFWFFTSDFVSKDTITYKHLQGLFGDITVKIESNNRGELVPYRLYIERCPYYGLSSDFDFDFVANKNITQDLIQLYVYSNFNRCLVARKYYERTPLTIRNDKKINFCVLVDTVYQYKVVARIFDLEVFESFDNDLYVFYSDVRILFLCVSGCNYKELFDRYKDENIYRFDYIVNLGIKNKFLDLDSFILFIEAFNCAVVFVDIFDYRFSLLTQYSVDRLHFYKERHFVLEE